MTATYRVTANNFLTTGGGGFTVFKEGTVIKNGAIDLDAFVEYMAQGPLNAPEGFGRTNVVTAAG
jgi:5'-nucleotidase